MMNSFLRRFLVLFLMILLLGSLAFAVDVEPVSKEPGDEFSEETGRSDDTLILESAVEIIPNDANYEGKTILFYSDYSETNPSTTVYFDAVTCAGLGREGIISFQTPEAVPEKEGWIFDGWECLKGESIYSDANASEVISLCKHNTTYYINDSETKFIFVATWRENSENIVASIGNNKYGSWSSAADAWTEGTTLKLLQDFSPNYSNINTLLDNESSDTEKTLDLNGHMINFSSGFSLYVYVSLTITDTSTTNTGSISSVEIATSGHLTIDGGDFSEYTDVSAILGATTENLTITGGVFGFDPGGTSPDNSDCYIPKNYSSSFESTLNCWKITVPQVYTEDISLSYDLSFNAVTVTSDEGMTADTPIITDTPYTVTLSKNGYVFGTSGETYLGKVSMTGNYGVISKTVTDDGLRIAFDQRYNQNIAFEYTVGNSLDATCVTTIADNFSVDSIQKNENSTAIVISISNGKPLAYDTSDKTKYRGTVTVNGETVSALLSEDELHLLVYIPIRYTVATYCDVTTVSGGGQYASGETVTLTANGLSGYDFLGWYLYDSQSQVMTKVSSAYSYSFEITADAEYYARYSPSNTIMLSVQVPSGGTVCVKQGDTEVKSLLEAIQDYPVTFGESYTVTFTAPDNYEFSYWANGYGKKLSESNAYSLTIYSNTTLQACVKPAAESGSYQVLWMDAYSQKISEDTITGNLSIATISPPASPARYGYTFAGWSLNSGGSVIATDELTDTIKTLLGSQSSVTLYASYSTSESSASETYYVTVSYVNGDTKKVLNTVTNQVTATKTQLQKGAFYKLEVPDTYNKLYLAGIRKPGETEYLSQGTAFSFMLTGNLSFEAVYQEDEADNEATIVISSVTAADNVIYFTASHNVPDGCTVLEHGIIRCVNQSVINHYNGDYTAFVIDSTLAGKSASTDTASNGTYTLGINQTGYLYDKLLARGYVIYINAEGETETLYSEPECVTYNSLANNS